MRARRFFSALAAVTAALALSAPDQADAQQYQNPQGYADGSAYQDYPMEARVWLDRGSEPVLRRGERVRIYYRTSEDAFVAIFHIDTNGTARMVFPSSPQENHYARGGRDYRVLFPGSSYWYVNDDAGMGYFFIVASPEPFDFREFRYSHYAGGWDLSYVGRQVYGDPYLAMDDYVASLVPDWEYVPYGLDFTTYHVDRHYDYPRFLCYDCHGFRPYSTWNPYAYHCSNYRVIIYNDPYYYPRTRYRGSRVVYVQPQRGVAHFGFKERGDGEPGTPQVVRRKDAPNVTTQPGVEGTQNRRATPRVGAPSTADPGVENRSGTATGQARPGVEGTTNRRTGTVTPTSPGARGNADPGIRESTRRGTPLTAPRNPKEGATSSRPSVRRLTDPVNKPGTSGRPILERRTPTERSRATKPKVGTPPRTTPRTRPSSTVRKPGSGGGSTARSGSGTTRRLPTVRSGGGTTTRPPAARSGSGTTRRLPTVRSGGGTTTRPPAARSGSGTTRRLPTVRSGGGTTTRPPAARSGGGATTRPPPRTTTPPKRRTTGGGGGGG